MSYGIFQWHDGLSSRISIRFVPYQTVAHTGKDRSIAGMRDTCLRPTFRESFKPCPESIAPAESSLRIGADEDMPVERYRKLIDVSSAD